MTTVWITKYWETKGVYSVDAEVNSERDMARVGDITRCGVRFYGSDFHETLEAATAHVIRAAHRKIESIDKKRKKIENLIKKLEGESK